MVLTLRAEHPETRFGVISLGATMPTEFADSFESGIVVEAVRNWIDRGLLQERAMSTDDVADVLLGIVGAMINVPDVNLDTIVVRSPSAPAHARTRFNPRPSQS
jgi:hypothetical protein